MRRMICGSSQTQTGIATPCPVQRETDQDVGHASSNTTCRGMGPGETNLLTSLGASPTTADATMIFGRCRNPTRALLTLKIAGRAALGGAVIIRFEASLLTQVPLLLAQP